MYPRFLQFGAFVISTYGVLAVVAALCGIALWASIARRTGLDPAKIQNAGLLAVVCVVVGARLAVVAANWRGFLEAPLLILSAGTLASGSAAIFGVVLAVDCSHPLPAAAHACRSCRALDAAAPAVDVGPGDPRHRQLCRRVALRRAHRGAVGRHLYQPLCRAHHRRALGHRAASCAALRSHRPLRCWPPCWWRCCVIKAVRQRFSAPRSSRTAYCAFCSHLSLATYAEAPALFHVVTPAQAVAMLMVVLGGAAAGSGRGSRNRRYKMPDTATAHRARSSFPPRPPAAGWISIWWKRLASAAPACSGCCRRRRCCSKASRPRPA